MVEGKAIALFFGDVFGFSFAFLGWLNNLDNVKSAVMFILGSAYIGARLYFYIRRQLILLRKEKWEQDEREKNKAA